MRLMQTLAGGDVGGAEEFFVRLVLALHRAGVAQRIAMRPNDARGDRLRAAGVETLHLPFGGMLDRRTVPGLAAAIDDFRPDIVLSWMSRATAMTTRAAARAALSPVRLARLGGYYDLKYYAGCDHLVGNTPDIVRYLIENGWPEDRAHFVPNFVAASAAAPVPRAALGVPDGVPLLLAAGRLHRNKAFDVLIGALKSLDGVYLLLAGDGGEGNALEGLAYKLGVGSRVRMLGWRGDVANLMATADMLVCPSRIEPLGNVVIEAWARHLPVVAAAASGPAWLIHDGEDGLLVPADDATALAGAIRRLIDDPALAASLAVAGQARYAADYNEDAVVDRYLALFDRVAG